MTKTVSLILVLIVGLTLVLGEPSLSKSKARHGASSKHGGGKAKKGSLGKSTGDSSSYKMKYYAPMAIIKYPVYRAQPYGGGYGGGSRSAGKGKGKGKVGGRIAGFFKKMVKRMSKGGFGGKKKKGGGGSRGYGRVAQGSYGGYAPMSSSGGYGSSRGGYSGGKGGKKHG